MSDLLPDPPKFPGAKNSTHGVTEDYPGQRQKEVRTAAIIFLIFLALAIAGTIAVLLSRGAL